MTEDLKNKISSLSSSGGFIKVTDTPVDGLTSAQKVILNRKGNTLLNEGKIEEAKRIFITTGYSDGLTRIGDVYLKKNKSIDALKLFLLAHNKKRTEPILEKIASIISVMIKE
ncbi:hypothetical protein HRQ91_06085 [Treponema parvum]|uniref:Uncharacterized protein n=1 Tax=Treponema parvum TaxID=138851 RepID=A0A975F4E6_9SPIR|nr:hypothetical protein [Treponema parvum]QTQ14058.1 hypothetical protein HRQ91_06085 [Treponema parvum]